MSAKTETQRGMRRRDILLATTTLAAASALVPSAYAQGAGTQQGAQPVTAASGNKPNIISFGSDRKAQGMVLPSFPGGLEPDPKACCAGH
jgi:hypothetical protein